MNECAANVYANFTGQTECLDISQQATGNLGDQGWDFQVRYRCHTSITDYHCSIT